MNKQYRGTIRRYRVTPIVCQNNTACEKMAAAKEPMLLPAPRHKTWSSHLASKGRAGNRIKRLARNAANGRGGLKNEKNRADFRSSVQLASIVRSAASIS